MRNSFLCLLIAVVSSLFYSCENRYRNRGQSVSAQQGVETLKRTSSKQVQQEGLSKDAYQVSASEFDEFFAYRYGLLYQKFSDTPFSGRVVTAEEGEEGDFVSLDEGWMDGKKHGVSTRWFSNGIKMYERNYNGGKWHGTVTRWWPNGQKMYVRAYTEGKRHGKEATWRSDGTPINLSTTKPSQDAETATSFESAPDQEDNLPSVSIPESTSLIEPSPAVDTPQSFDPANVEPSFEPIGLPAEPALEPEMTDSFPVFEPLGDPVGSTEAPSQPEPDLGLPPLSEPSGSNDSDLPAFPAPQPDMPSNSSGGDELPPMPVTEEAAPRDDLPPLPGATAREPDGLPPLAEGTPEGLPSMPSDGGLPPLPGDGGLPPLPGDGGLPPLPGDGGLPPLPPLP